MEPERQHRGGDARAAGRDHGAVEIDARGLEGASQLAGPEERAVPRVEPLVRQVEAVRDVTGAQPRARLGLGADKTAVRARVEHLLAAAREVCAHLLEIAHEAPAKTGRVAAPPGRGQARLDGPTLGAPLREAPVENGDPPMAEGAERPPDARRADDATRVVDDDAIGVRDPQPADALRELPRAREHVRQGRAQVGDLVDVEEHGAGDVRLDELLEGLAPKPSHVPRAVDDAQVAAAAIRDEPPGRDERRELHRSRLRLRPSASRSVSHLR